MSDELKTMQLEVYLQAGNAEAFVDFVGTAREKKANMVLMTMPAFVSESDLLYSGWRYAFLRGIEVRLAPQPREVAAV